VSEAIDLALQPLEPLAAKWAGADRTATFGTGTRGTGGA
jgi:hypothetical protein